MRTASCLVALLVLAGGACHIERAESGRPAGTRTAVDSLNLVERDSTTREEVRQALRNYYNRFSRRDWPALAAMFWDRATITTRWTRSGERAERVVVQTIDEFVRAAPARGGGGGGGGGGGPGRLAVFSEQPLGMDIHSYGDLAQAWVVYRARFGTTRDSVAVHHGVDAFHLMKHDGAWRITGLTFITESPDRPLAR